MSDTRIIRRYKTATVAVTTISAEVNVGGTPVRGALMPAAWTTADLTFQAADQSGGTFANVYDVAGNEIQVSAAASRAIGFSTVDMETLRAFQYIKVRSGTSGAPVTQDAARTVVLVLGM